MTRDSIRQIGVTLATISMLVNYILADVVQYNGLTTFEATQKINIYFLPARFAFLIWGFIFLGLIAYTVFQALPSQKENDSLRKIGWWYVAGTLVIISWMISLHYQNFLLSTLTMTLVLISLLVIYHKLDIGIELVTPAMRILVHLPFSIYLGWITMASISNISNLLYSTGWNGFGISDKIWAVVMMVMTIVIAELTAFNRQDLAYLAVFVWSFIGLAVNNRGVSPVFEAACVSAGIVIVITMVTLIARTRMQTRTGQNEKSEGNLSVRSF